MMCIAGACRVPGAHSRRQQLLALVGDQHEFPREHVDELVLERVPVPQRRLSTRAEGDDIDAEPREPAGVAQLALGAIAHAGPKGLRIAGCADFRDRFRVERRETKRRGHDGRSSCWGMESTYIARFPGNFPSCGSRGAAPPAHPRPADNSPIARGIARPHAIGCARAYNDGPNPRRPAAPCRWRY